MVVLMAKYLFTCYQYANRLVYMYNNFCLIFFRPLFKVMFVGQLLFYIMLCQQLWHAKVYRLRIWNSLRACTFYDVLFYISGCLQILAWSGRYLDEPARVRLYVSLIAFPSADSTSFITFHLIFAVKQLSFF
jgi:hypothetical protein